jgi:hypothetical protein
MTIQSDIAVKDRWSGLDRMDVLLWPEPWRQGRLRRRVAVKTLDAMAPAKSLSSMRSRPNPRPRRMIPFVIAVVICVAIGAGLGSASVGLLFAVAGC